MNLDPAWPSGTTELVLWIELVSIWIIASYWIAGDEQGKGQGPNGSRWYGRAFLATGLVGASGWWLPAPGTNVYVRIALCAWFILAMTTTALVRKKLTLPHLRRLAEWEIGTCLFVALASGAAIGLGQIGRVSLIYLWTLP